jgi:POT family proton-dependent oligopeptide transporter
MIAMPNEQVFKFGLATIIAGNGLFKPNISTMVGKLYVTGDERRDSGFTLFYMGINLGAMISPFLTSILAEKVFGTETMPAYKIVFIVSGIGMLISLVWFWLGRGQLKGVGEPPVGGESVGRVAVTAICAVAAIPLIYFLLNLGAGTLQWILTAMFIALAVLLLVEGIRNGPKQRDMVIAMLIIFAFNVLFWCFFEQAGSSFSFLADQIVNRKFGDWTFPVGWFQSINSIAIITMAPLMAWLWVKMGKANPSIPRKFGLGLIFNGLAFALLWFALSSLVDAETLKIPFWTLFAVYWIQSIGELCLSPIGLSMVTKLAPMRLVGFGMGGWFLSTGIGNNLSGIFASHVSGETGMTVQSAQAGYTFGFWALVIPGVLLFVIAPLIQKLMHGVK